MVTRYLLDSDAVIDILKGRHSTIELIDNLHGQGDALCTCAVVIAEVFAGLSPIEQQRGQTLLGSMPFLIMTHSAA